MSLRSSIGGHHAQENDSAVLTPSVAFVICSRSDPDALEEPIAATETCVLGKCEESVDELKSNTRRMATQLITITTPITPRTGKQCKVIWRKSWQYIRI